MKDLIRTLTVPSGPSGDEFAIKESILRIVEPHVDEWYEDVLGNLYVIKKARSEISEKTVMIVAHMDEPALSVIDIDEDGFLRIAPLGPLHAASLVGARVVFARTGRRGVVGAEHNVALKDLEFSHLFIDIGAQTQSDAMRDVQIGDAATFAYGFEEVGNQLIVGHALDNRVGCALLIDALQHAQSDYTIVGVFSAQKEVGSRGAKVAGHRIHPTIALVLDISPSGDTPKAERSSLTLGAGVAVKVLDATMVVSKKWSNHLIEAAKNVSASYQIEVAPRTTSDAGAIFLAQSGIPTCGLAIPARYVGTPSQMVSLADVTSAQQVLHNFLSLLS
ncbi:M42 family metallopeptidase [Sulfoacidibacillus thermotolerans]|uniref:Aminopeptidase n=1 Tax=Sulfoacidibacillus thermotolerans TaxID=1765684 RepID=A0A2U3D726_SULT2|nr:M42 family peptidase [Sulfoacidibacillus thermotolerans]PWI57053.1 hypothetical protein BM613_10385 [Sulfoacidibacillus thermotolerans]